MGTTELKIFDWNQVIEISLSSGHTFRVVQGSYSEKVITDPITQTTFELFTAQIDNQESVPVLKKTVIGRTSTIVALTLREE